MSAPLASRSCRASITSHGAGPFMTRSPATRIASGFVLRDRRPDGLERDDVAVDVGQDRDPGRHRSTSADGMMNEMRPSQDDLAVDGRDGPAAAEPRPELLHRHLEAEGVARHDDPLEADLVDAGEQPDPIAEPGLLGDVDGHRLGQRLDLHDARHDRQAREVATEEPLGRSDALLADDPLRVGVVFDDPIDEQERPAMRDECLDLAGGVDGGLGHGRLRAGWSR